MELKPRLRLWFQYGERPWKEISIHCTSRWAVPVGSEHWISSRGWQLAPAALASGCFTQHRHISHSSCRRHEDQCNTIWLLKVLELARTTPDGPDPKPCKVIPSPATMGACPTTTMGLPRDPTAVPPGFPQDGSNPCPTTGRRYPRVRQALMQRPVSHKQKPALASACLLTTNCL